MNLRLALAIASSGLLTGLLLSAANPAFAQASGSTSEATSANLTLDQIMSDPDWIGAPVEQAWWALDGQNVYYRIKEQGSELRELHQFELASNKDHTLPLSAWGEVDGSDFRYNQRETKVVFTRDGDVFMRNVLDDELFQLTRTPEGEREAFFSHDGDYVYFQRGQDWYQYELLTHLISPVADLQFSDDPNAEQDDDLRDMQLRLFSTLKDQERNAKLRREQREERSHQDYSILPGPWYLGSGWEAAGSSLSSDGRYLLLAVQKAGHNDGRGGKMPLYVTASGYVDIEDVRPRVGRNAPAAHQVWILDLQERSKEVVDLAGLPGITEQPLAFLKDKKSSKKEQEAEPRSVQLVGAEWQPGTDIAAIQLQSIDNKDRWIVTVDASKAKLTPRHRLHNKGWINWLFNDFGWTPDGEKLWYLSEESGFSHLYTLGLKSKKAQAVTAGEFEVMSPVFSVDGQQVFVLSNRSHSSEYDVYRVDLDGDNLERMTELKGVEDFSLSPDGEQLLLRWSSSYVPAQVSVLDMTRERMNQLTDTRTEAYSDMQWQAPEIVGVPSQHGVEQPIWSKFYPPQGEFNGKRPIVLFVHGAGYTQNTHLKFPYYFREQMFHNLLTQQGYLVLDMDYRASRGYGSDWRTAIYRQMGHPELEDLIDGVRWLVEEHNGDPDRVGVYGGSYGGFMSLMAMFRAPETFHAGAALRPVTDWAHYNHGYTSNILNTPQDDPEAYKKSSPIEFAENLEGHLLIAHGMLDDNVFYQDSVRLAQRLIELKKDHWELASYPMERHGFVYPESWYDEYRRIYQLFERTIGDQAAP